MLYIAFPLSKSCKFNHVESFFQEESVGIRLVSSLRIGVSVVWAIIFGRQVSPFNPNQERVIWRGLRRGVDYAVVLH